MSKPIARYLLFKSACKIGTRQIGVDPQARDWIGSRAYVSQAMLTTNTVNRQLAILSDLVLHIIS